MDSSSIIRVALGQAGEASPAPPATDYGFWSSIVNAGIFEQAVMGLLLIFSVVSWAIIYFKARGLSRAYSESDTFLDVFWGSKRLDSIYQKSEGLAASPVSKVFRAGYVELAKLKKKDGEDAKGDVGLGSLESVQRSMRRASSSEITGLESLVPFLATVGSTSPFIGLLGTVMGIVTSFQEIGRLGNANLATVAPGIGGALVATAFGLFAAIPAVIAYNYFVNRIRVLEVEMENFSADFLNIIKRHFF
ncbi:MAG: protein TolQ [Myxococcota bacterium]